MALTRREGEALDEAKRVLRLAEDNKQYGNICDRLIEIADRWLVVARQSG